MAAPQPPPPTINAAVVSLSHVPAAGSAFSVFAAADYGGGLSMHGADFQVRKAGDGWQVTPGRVFMA